MSPEYLPDLFTEWALLHYRLNFDPGMINQIFYHSSKEHLNMSKIAKFSYEMLLNEENIAS